MMLSDLLDAVAATGALPSSQLPSYKTSIGYLARALGCPDAQHCPQETFARSQDELRHALDTYLGSLKPPPSSHTVRNTRYNIRTLFKKAYEAHILQPRESLMPSPLTKKALVTLSRANSPYKQRLPQAPYHLPLRAWPPDILTCWNRYVTERRRTLRPKTLDVTMKALTRYLGYFHNIVHQPATCWDDLFSVERLDTFVLWHAERSGVRCTTAAHLLVNHLIAVALHFKHAQVQALKDYRRTMPYAEPMHNKHELLLSRDDLERVALSELQAAHKPVDTRTTMHQPGISRAIHYRRALILRILLRIPLRQRNICEMQLHRNLYQDTHNHWWLSFRGDELKVGRRNGKTNTFSLDMTAYFPDIIADLEEYLTVFRPRFLHAVTSPYVFLTSQGHPLNTTTLCTDFTACILKWTEKRCYPHLLRTLWVSEFFAAGGKPATAAYMLNDSVQTALQKYQEFIDADHLQEASEFNKKLGK